MVLMGGVCIGAGDWHVWEFFGSFLFRFLCDWLVVARPPFFYYINAFAFRSRIFFRLGLMIF